MRVPLSSNPFPMHEFDLRASRSLIEPPPSTIEPVPAAPLPAPQTPGRLTRLGGLIFRRHRAILITLLACVIAAAVPLRFATPLYTSSAQIMIQRIAQNNQSQSSDDRQRALRNEEELIVSTPVLASALTMPGVHDITPLRGRSDALKLMKQQIRVDSGKGDDLLNIAYDAANPREGVRLLAAVVDSYVRFRSGLHGAFTDGSAATVMAERQKALQNLEQKRSVLDQFAAQHGLAQGNEQVDAADEALHEMGMSLAQARVETIAARAAYDQMQQDLASDPRMRDRLAQSRDNDSSLADGDQQAIARQIVALKTQLAGYGTKFMANYEPVQLLHRKIDDLKFTRDAIIQQRWLVASRTESELVASYDQEETAVAQSQANQQLFEQHQSDVADAQKQVAQIDKQLKEIDSANKLITTMVTVIEPATASERPTRPHASTILMIAAAMGLALGLGIAAVRDRRVEADSLSTLKMLADGLPLLARLPAVPRIQLSMNSWRDRMVDSAAEFAEACRQVQQALEAVNSFSGGRTVMVTSTAAREGKSTLASLLALTLAQTGKRVLLVDANLHAPAQGDIFGIAGDFGLGELLEGEIESSFVSHVHPGTDPGLDVLLSGTSSLSIEEMLNSQRFTNLMAAMASEYDYVLLDSPALSAGADARIIASSCDATIVLASESSLSRKVLTQTRDSLTSVGANVIGVVINGGMSAMMPSDALASLRVERRAPVQVTTLPPRVTPAVMEKSEADPVMEPMAQPVQTVFAAQVRRAEKTPELAEERFDGDRRQSIWSYALCLIVLLGSWMAFSAAWGTPGLHRVKVMPKGRLVSPDAALPIQEEPVAMLMAGCGLLVAAVVSGTRIRPPRQEVALMAICCMLMIAAFYGGVTDILWMAQRPGISVSLMAEAILLFASVLCAWAVVGWLSPSQLIDPDDKPAMGDIALGVFAQASTMAAMMILLSRWQTRGECMAVTAFSSCLAAMLACVISSVRSSTSLWLSPLVVALFGYVCAAAAAHGVHVGMLIALARPLPMDYASMGPIGAVLGFWIARSATRISLPATFAVE
jgi:succinoglycan biosynthesis transport protein ExoP